MSGGFSVPFATLAVFSGEKYQQIIWALLALGAFGFSAFRLWESEHKKVVALRAELAGGHASLKHFVRQQDRFTLWQAGRLLGKTPMRQENISGEAAGYLHLIKVRILDGSIEPLNAVQNELYWARMDRHPLLLASGDGKPRDIRAGLQISKADLRDLAAEYKIEIPGIE